MTNSATNPNAEKPSRLNAIFRSRCPSCLTGEAFQSYLKMHKACPHCGIVFEREHGYFLNSIFLGYVINGLLLGPVVLYGIWTDRLGQVALPLIAAIALLAPFTFRYARVMWMHLDEMMDPRAGDR